MLGNLDQGSMCGPPNKGMKLSKPEYLVGGWPTGLGIIESGFAAYAQCSADSGVEHRAATGVS
jgi:hypothetical protein